MTPQQVQALLAAGIPVAQIAAMMGAAPAAAATVPAAEAPVSIDRVLNAIRSAPAPTDYDDGYSDKENPGRFDGRYRVRVKRLYIANTRKSGNKLAVTHEILASSNPLVYVGENREHAIFLDRADAALSEAQGLYQKFYAARGNAGPYTDEFARAATGEGQPCAGLEFDVDVSTKPQAGNKDKVFTHVSYSPVQGPAPAVSGNTTFQAPPAPTSASAPAAGMVTLSPELLAMFAAQQVQAAPVVAAPAPAPAPVGPTLPPELAALFGGAR
jgi:hypothetical protein